MNKLKIILLSILGVFALYVFILFIQNIIAQNDIKKLSKDEYISILKDDGVNYEFAPPISRRDILNIKNRKLYKIIYFNRYDSSFIFVRKIPQEKIDELLKMIEEGLDHYEVKESKIISPAELSGYYYVDFKEKKVKLENIPFSY